MLEKCNIYIYRINANSNGDKFLVPPALMSLFSKGYYEMSQQ